MEIGHYFIDWFIYLFIYTCIISTHSFLHALTLTIFAFLQTIYASYHQRKRIFNAHYSYCSHVDNKWIWNAVISIFMPLIYVCMCIHLFMYLTLMIFCILAIQWWKATFSFIIGLHWDWHWQQSQCNPKIQ